MLKVEVKGFDKLQKRLDDIAERARKLDGNQQTMTLADLMNNDFIAEHSSFGSFDELLSASPFHVETKEDFEAIPDDAWDDYIAGATSFASWEEMQHAAAAEHMKRQLGF